MAKDKLQVTEETRLQAKLDKTYAMPNYLIRAKYETSILEEYVMAWALAHSDDIVRTRNGSLVYSFSAGVIKEIIGTEKSHSFYDRLEQTAKLMVGHTMGINDPVNNYFDYVNVVIRATYEKGKFSIYFNPEIPLLHLKKNFTPLSLAVTMGLTSKYSIRLYKTLQSKCYLPKGSTRRDDYFEVVMSVAELKLEMGVVNAELPEVKKVLRGSAHPDFEAAVEKSAVQKHKRWADFKKWVIQKAVDEINEKKELTKMHVEFKGRRGGKGAEIKTVEFYITILDGAVVDNNNEPEQEDSATNQERDMVAAQILLKLCGKGMLVTIEEAQAIAKACNYNIYELDKAVMTLEGSTTPVENKVGFIISALKENYQITRNQINKYMVERNKKTYIEGKEATLISEEMEFSKDITDMYVSLKKEDEEDVYEQTELELPFDIKFEGYEDDEEEE